jgi:hypothetical protein
MKNPTVFLGGIPTEPDVKRLEEALGVPEEGAVVSWEALEGVLHDHRRAHRFLTVVNAWRRKLHREHNVVMVAVRGEGLMSAPPDVRLDSGARRIRSGFRSIFRAGTVLEGTDRNRLTTDQRKALDHNLRVSTQARMAAAMESRRLKAGTKGGKEA